MTSPDLLPSNPASGTAPARVLVVDPDAAARQWAARSLRPQGHEVHLSADADQIERAAQRGFDLLLMDSSARASRGTRHGFDAWQRLRGLRDQGVHLPVIVTQTASDSADRTVAFELGADAVIDKPFEPRELRARVASLLRRSREPGHRSALAARRGRGGLQRFGGWTLDADMRRLHTPTGMSVVLSHAECRLLQAFIERPHDTLPRHELLDLARGAGVDQLERSIDLLVSRLRHKLDDDPRSPSLIRTVRGVGYLFAALDVTEQAAGTSAGDTAGFVSGRQPS
ncbi:MAG TPA: response regulator transcription factor [Ideonella sp.]|nr:response regulator transcription factor [Ideonella sp.]